MRLRVALFGPAAMFMVAMFCSCRWCAVDTQETREDDHGDYPEVAGADWLPRGDWSTAADAVFFWKLRFIYEGATKNDVWRLLGEPYHAQIIGTEDEPAYEMWRWGWKHRNGQADLYFDRGGRLTGMNSYTYAPGSGMSSKEPKRRPVRYLRDLQVVKNP